MKYNTNPCPFCKGTDHFTSYEKVTATDDTPWSVYCRGCDTRGPGAASEAEAVALWNDAPLHVDFEKFAAAPVELARDIHDAIKGNPGWRIDVQQIEQIIRRRLFHPTPVRPA